MLTAIVLPAGSLPEEFSLEPVASFATDFSISRELRAIELAAS